MRLWVLTFLCSLALGSLVRHDAVFAPDHVLHVTAQNISIACQNRFSLIVNGTTPGPEIRIPENATSWIRVYNDMEAFNLTMHWHGLTMRTAPFADGTPQASQWPIPPGHFFDYELHPMIGDAGTYFYHSHVGVQAATVTGALIIDDVYSPPYLYDDEIVFGLQDHYNMTDVAIQAGLVAQPFVWTGESNGIMLNGRSGAFLNSSASSADLTCSPAIITVKANQTYRFRFIGETAISLVTLGIEDHDNFTVIEADGRYTQPFSTDHMQISTGQRFSVLFRTKTVEELQALNTKYFWIQMENRGRPVNLTSYAILQYNVPELSLPATPVEIPATKPLTLPSNFSYWLEYSLQPYQGPGYEHFPTLDQVNRTVTISVAQFLNYSDSGTIQWAEHGDIWQESRIAQPYLVNIYQNGQSAIPNYTAALENGGWDPQTLAYPAKLGEVIDVVWLNDNGFSGGWDIHPFHGHSDHYWDLGSGNGTYDAVENAKKMNDINYTPVLRDTTMLYRYATSGVPQTVAGWRAWRLNITNPGVWMLHCHILPHMIMGMQTAWVFGNAADITAKLPEPYVSGYLTYGGDAYGNSTYDPLVWHYF